MTKKNKTKIAARARQERFGGKYLHHQRVAGGGGGEGPPHDEYEPGAFDDAGAHLPEDLELGDEHPKVAAMVEWFFDHFEDPANGVPHDSGEGAYQYIFGGPYDARDELADNFADVDERHHERAATLIEKYGWEWVKRGEY